MRSKKLKYMYKLFMLLLLIPFVPFRIDEQNIPNDSQTLVAFTLDDAYTSWVDVIDPLLEKYNISITGFINDPDGVLRDLTWSEIEMLADTGRWEFGWHGTNHFLLTRLTREEKEAQISGFIDLFENHSLPRPETFAYPFGGYDYSTILETSQYFSVARTVSEGVNSVYWVQEKPMQIRVIRIYEDRDNDYYMNVVSENVDEGVLIVFYLHSVEQTVGAISGPTEITTVDFERLIKWLVEQDVLITNFSQGIDKMRGRCYETKYIIKLDNPFDVQITSSLPIPSRYWEMIYISANVIGNYNIGLGDLILKYIAPITTFILLSLLFGLYITRNLIKNVKNHDY